MNDITSHDILFRTQDRNKSNLTSYYDTEGILLGSYESEIARNYIVVNKSLGFSSGNMFIVPDKTTLNVIHSGTGANQSGMFLFAHRKECGIIVSIDGSCSTCVFGDSGRITKEQWEPAVGDINKKVSLGKMGKQAAYTIHLHPAITGPGCYGDGIPSTDDYNNFFYDKGVSIILFFSHLCTPPKSDNDVVRYITIYNKTAVISTMKWTIFKKLCINILNQQ